MNPALSLQAFLLAAATIDFTGTFYAQVDGRYERLKLISTPDVGVMTLADSRFPNVPLFTLNHGVAMTMNGEDSQVFGRLHDYFAIGRQEYVKPYKLQLGEDSKVLNVHMNVCKSPLRFFPKVTLQEGENTEGMECSPIEIYFLSPAEVMDDVL